MVTVVFCKLFYLALIHLAPVNPFCLPHSILSYEYVIECYILSYEHGLSWTYYVIHSHISGHLECSQLLVFADSSARVNMLYTSPVHMYEDLSRILTRNGIAALKEHIFSSWARIAKDSLMWWNQFKLPLPVGSLFLHVFFNTCCCGLYEVLPLWCDNFSLHFSDHQWYRVTFHMCISLKVSFSVGYLFKPSAHLLWVIIFKLIC